MAATHNTNKNEKRVEQFFTIKLGEASKGKQTRVKDQQKSVVFRSGKFDSQATGKEAILEEGEIIHSERIDLKSRLTSSWHGG